MKTGLCPAKSLHRARFRETRVVESVSRYLSPVSRRLGSGLPADSDHWPGGDIDVDTWETWASGSRHPCSTLHPRCILVWCVCRNRHGLTEALPNIAQSDRDMHDDHDRAFLPSSPPKLMITAQLPISARLFIPLELKYKLTD
jgi:hypothetical protein